MSYHLLSNTELGSLRRRQIQLFSIAHFLVLLRCGAPMLQGCSASLSVITLFCWACIQSISCQPLRRRNIRFSLWH